MDSDQSKLFVGGISWETREETLKEHFQQYGEVVETVILKDRNTGNGRGFGFVLLSEPSAADRALKEKHVILGRTVEVKKAFPRGDQQPHQRQPQNKGYSKNAASSSSSNSNGSVNHCRTKKIFVGGLSSNLTEPAFKSYFEKFGRITDVVVMYDSVTQRPRGFGFITFDSEEAVENAMQKIFHDLNGKVVEVKRAVPKEGGSASHNGNNTNSNGSHNTRMGNGRSPSYGYGTYQGPFYPPSSPAYRVFPGYVAPPVPGYGHAVPYSYGMYPVGGYNGVAYVPPTSPWNGFGVGARRSPMPYGNPSIYPPPYMNGSVAGYAGASSTNFVGMHEASNGGWNQNGSNGHVSREGNHVVISSPRSEGETLGNGVSDSEGENHGAAAADADAKNERRQD